MTQHTVITALARLLRPLIRILLRRGISIDVFEEVSRRVYVEVARDSFAIEGRKQTASRIGVLTGLNRKEVARLLNQPPAIDGTDIQRHNRAERVLSAWLREPEFLDEKGDPEILAFEGEDSFSTLVKRFSGDMTARAVADELLRVGAIEEIGNGAFRMLSRGYVPEADDEQSVTIFGLHSADLLETFDRNLDPDADHMLWQRQVTYSRLPVSAISDFKKFSSRWGQQLLEELDRWLAERKLSDEDQETPAVRLGFGMYQIETEADIELSDQETS